MLLLSPGMAQTPLQKQIEATHLGLFSKEDLFLIKSSGSNRAQTLNQYVKSYEILEVNSSALNRIASNSIANLEIDVPVKGSHITLQLIKSKVVDENTVFTTQSGKVNYQSGAYYSGIVKGQSNTLVAISFFNNSIIGVITNEQGNYVLGNSNTQDRNSNEYILYNDKDLLIKKDFNCYAKTSGSETLPIVPMDMNRSLVADKCVKVYIEADYQVYLNQGSNTTNVLNFVTGLFNVTKTIYQNESIITSISQINVWTVSDPYVTGNSTSEVLNLFEDAMSAGYNGDIAHLFSARNLGGGSAWVDVLCWSDKGGRTAVSANLDNTTPGFPTYSWNVNVVTHEMGHNLGSTHTHNCAWNGNNTAIDGCATPSPCANPGIPAGGGTIMSYCHMTGVGINFNLGFGPQPGNLIRSRVANATCISYCCPSDITITGTYSTPLTESQTWIKSSGQTTILSSANVKLDADPVNGYILFQPASSSDFFYAAPTGSGSFIASVLDGCAPGIPQKPAITTNSSGQINVATRTAGDVTVYPNPSTGIINIQSTLDQSAHIRVINVMGQTLYYENYTTRLDLTGLKDGIYFLQILSKESTLIVNTKISIE